MISLATFVKDEESCIEHMVSSVLNYVDEIVVVDTGSTDQTLDICKKYTDRIYTVGFSDFGSIRTLTAHLCSCEWILMLDADETLESPELLADITRLGRDAFALPRKRWLNLDRTQQTELEAYPDWQVRFFRNNKDYVWKRELHEFFHGTEVVHLSDGPVIHHFHDVFKTPDRLKKRMDLYSELAHKAHVTVEGGFEL